MPLVVHSRINLKEQTMEPSFVSYLEEINSIDKKE